MRDKLKIVLQSANRKYDKFVISLYPVELITQNQKFGLLKGYLSKISESSPLFFKTGVIQGNILKTCIIYDYNFFPKFFESKDNDGERNIMKLFLSNLFSFLAIEHHESKVSSLVEEFMPKTKKAFLMI